MHTVGNINHWPWIQCNLDSITGKRLNIVFLLCALGVNVVKTSGSDFKYKLQ